MASISQISLSIAPTNKSTSEIVRRRKNAKFEKVDKQKSYTDLPTVLLTEIVCRLSASSLYKILKIPSSLRNKEFHSIISDPRFPELFKSYDNNTSNVHPCSLVAYNQDANMFLIEFDSDRNFVLTQLNTDFISKVMRKKFVSPYLDYKVLGSCNGCLLVSLGYHIRHHRGTLSTCESIALVNPLTHRYVRIPRPSISSKSNRYAFDYVPNIGKYKVMRFCDDDYESFTVSESKWSKPQWVRNRKPNYSTYIKNQIFEGGIEPVVFKGSSYWVVDEMSNILKLDMDKEEFELIPTPWSVYKTLFCDAVLSVLNDSLCMVFVLSEVFDIWVMNHNNINNQVKEPWTKFMTIPDPSFSIQTSFEIIRVFDNGNIVILAPDKKKPEQKKVYVYDTKQKKMIQEKVIQIQGMGILSVRKVEPSFLSITHHPQP
ncbi:putative F-box protein At3g16210 [Spinacia oleracea]|uniref:F-box protein At3g16210 n=1 Tax=Spinacia oleracea TaxID=3562 RepID=A0A9R0ILY0_SPIOL|nr:putative F-box protein At3g16210 [Spinacia oleracea]